MELNASDIASITGGTIAAGPADARASSFTIDSRVLEPGACFVALVAVRDGHDFVGDAFARGATVALVAREVPAAAGARALVVVADPLRALGMLGAEARTRLEGTPVVGITGSAGKTGTKDLMEAALGGPPAVHASPGSWNNEAGVPLTLLATPPGARAVVLEMGARAQGDLATLCAIARPTAGVITNVGLAHAGPLGGPEGVARAKGELFEALPAGGLGVLDLHDAASDGIAARTAARVLRVSARGAHEADVRAVGTRVDELLRPRFTIESPWGSHAVGLEVRGEHVVVNALLAAAVALDAGLAIEAVVAGLASARPARWRMDVSRGPNGVVVVNDAYNANPASTAAALRSLAAIPAPGRRIAVLGDMRELGDHSVAEHARIGDLTGALGIDALVCVGEETAPLAAAARAGGVERVTTVDDAAGALTAVTDGEAPSEGDVVLVKGSRAVGLEAVALALLGGCDHEGSAP